MNAPTSVGRSVYNHAALLWGQRSTPRWNLGRRKREERRQQAKANPEIPFHCAALLAFQQTADFPCWPPQRGRPAWHCRSGSPITCCAETCHVEPLGHCTELACSLEDRAARVHQPPCALALRPSWPSRCITSSVFPPLPNVNGVHVFVYLAATCTVVLMVLKPKSLDCCLKKPSCKEIKVIFLEGLSSWKYLLQSFNAKVQCS